MRGLGGSTLRGGQTVFHGLRMWGQLVQAAMMLSAFMVVALPAWNLWRTTSGAEWYAAGMYTLAEVKLVLGYEPGTGQEIRFPDGTRRVLTIREIASSAPAWEARERIKAEMFASAILGAEAGLGVIALFLAWFWYCGVQLSRRRRIRGAELVTAGELRRRVRRANATAPLRRRARDALPGAGRPAPYSIAGVPYPERTETQHTIVSGTTGSGKTVLISDLVAQIRAKGERCVIYDKMGSYTAAFLDPARDVLMNPLDARAPRWSPFLEARTPRDFDMMAAALIPQQKDTVDPFWVTAARQLFSNGAGVFWNRGVTENSVLVDHLLKTDLTALTEAMEGTVAQSIVDPENPKTALSVRAMLTANLSALEFLPDTGKPFSIREWISDEDKDGFLFLTSRGDQHASLRGLISTWLEIAVNAMLSLAQDDGRHIWVILDELPTLHQVPSLQPGLAESRKFGGCFVLGVQVASAFRGHLPQRGRARALPPGIRDREDPCRRALRDRGRLARGDRRVLDPPGRDRGGHGGTRHGIPLRQSAPPERAALVSRAAKRDIDRDEFTGVWQRQAADLGFDAPALGAQAAAKGAEREGAGRESGAVPAGAAEPGSLTGERESVREGAPQTPSPGRGRAAERTPVSPAERAVEWAVVHLSEREAVFSRTDLLTAALAWDPGKVTVGEAEAAAARLEGAGSLHAARLPGMEGLLTTDRAVGDEKETIALMEAGRERGATPMRARAVDKALRKGPLTDGQKAAVKLILSEGDRVVGVQGYAGSGKTTMLSRARALLEKRGYEVRGLAPSASAARTLEGEAGIGAETLQRFLARYGGVAAGRMTAKGEKEMRAAFAKTVLVVDEGSLASTVQARDLLRIADSLRIPRVVLVGDEKQLDAVDAGKPFAQLQAAGMKTAVMDQIMRQRDPALKSAAPPYRPRLGLDRACVPGPHRR